MLGIIPCIADISSKQNKVPDLRNFLNSKDTKQIINKKYICNMPDGDKCFEE